MFENFKNTAEKLSQDAIDKIKGQTDDIKQSIDNKMQLYVIELNELLPAIYDIGYQVDLIEIEIGMPPKIIPSFSKIKDVSKEIIQNILNKYSDKKISTLILSSLIKADNMQNEISGNNLIFTGISLEVGIIPTVKLKFIPNTNEQLQTVKKPLNMEKIC